MCHEERAEVALKMRSFSLIVLARFYIQLIQFLISREQEYRIQPFHEIDHALCEKFVSGTYFLSLKACGCLFDPSRPLVAPSFFRK